MQMRRPQESFEWPGPLDSRKTWATPFFNFALPGRPFDLKVISSSRICTLPQVRAVQASAFRRVATSWPREAKFCCLYDLALPEKFSSTDCFIQSTTIWTGRPTL